MSLVLQMENTYMNRASGIFLQNNGIYVIPNIRWGDERSYHQHIVGDIPFSFIGVEKNGIVSVGTYGCIRGNDNKAHFREGLEAMITHLEPKIVIVYGAMPDDVFSNERHMAVSH